MSRATGPIRAELSDAVLAGIRQRGPEAVGLLIVGLARLAIGSLTFGALLGIGTVFGYGATPLHAAGLAAATTLCVWRASRAARF
jgi:hypothetical protein